MRILITGAAGNLGSNLARYLLNKNHELLLMQHKKKVDSDIASYPGVRVVNADLEKPATLEPVIRDLDCVVHFAGILFKPNPHRFLPKTNVEYFRNLTDACIAAKVKKIILISFPHTEGETSPENPATDRLDGNPASVHARTRLEEEKYLIAASRISDTTAVILRPGMIYARGILMIDAARWLAKRWLLGVWRKPTWMHLISLPDFLAITESAIIRKEAQGIYNLGDDGKHTLQEFFDIACSQWKCKKPWRMHPRLILAAAWMCEKWALIFGTRSPLTRDFVKIGMASYYGDTSRTKSELQEKLIYPTINDGKQLL